MDNLNDVIDLVVDCGLGGSQLSIHVDTDYPNQWGMYIKNDGGVDYYLSTYINGGYMLQAQAASPQALITSGPTGLIGITRDPEEGVCSIFLPKLKKAVLNRSLHSLRTTIKAVRQVGIGLNNN